MLFAIIIGVLGTIFMLSKVNLSKKVCKCCFTRLSTFKKRDIREIKSLDLLAKLNESREKIRSRSCVRKDKVDDSSRIELSDLVCQR
jgi:hypothetical protein